VQGKAEKRERAFCECEEQKSVRKWLEEKDKKGEEMGFFSSTEWD